MRRVTHTTIVGFIAAAAIAAAQDDRAGAVLKQARAALGGDAALAAVTSLTATGSLVRRIGDAEVAPTDVEIAVQLPDKYVRKDVVAVVADSTITRTHGFNGSSLIDATDVPPALSSAGGGGRVVMMGPGMGGRIGGAPTPEETDARQRASLQSSREEFAKLMLGAFATSFAGMPLTFTYLGPADSTDGKADLIGVAGEGDFSAKLFLDQKTHLPLMVSWMAKEPLQSSVTSSGPGRQTAHIGPGGATVTGGATPGMSQADRDAMMKDLEERRKEAEASRRVVEYRLYYGGYKTLDGVKVPTMLRQSIDGKPGDELTLEKIKLNPKIDPSKFAVKK